MTDQADHLPELDAAAASAADGLRRHVHQHLDVERGLAVLPTAPEPHRSRSRILAVAAAVVLMVGMVAVIGQSGDGRSRLDLDEDGNPLPAPEPGVLTPLGPTDGKDSIQLPITIEPTTGLRDGTLVVASGTGFAPGEQVGIVQCAIEAGGDSPETRGGIDGCDIGSVVYADADEEGAASGSFRLRRTLTTPLTGTVDCAAEANRCIVAMGAIADYDRSGGIGFTIAGGGEPIAIPAVTVTPTDGLGDEDVVQLVGTGFNPGDVLLAEICAPASSTCWSTRTAKRAYEVPVDHDGRIQADLVVYRFLPGTEPGTYVDCAVSACSLRVSGGSTAPPPVPLSFVNDSAVPVPPAIAVDPTTGLAVGDRVVVRGTGFAPGEQVTVSLCAGAPGTLGSWPVCSGMDGGTLDTGEDGSFAVELELPDLGAGIDLGVFDGSVTTMCADDCVTSAPPVPFAATCDGVTSTCAIVVESWSEDEGAMGRRFQPVPVEVRFR